MNAKIVNINGLGGNSATLNRSVTPAEGRLAMSKFEIRFDGTTEKHGNSWDGKEGQKWFEYSWYYPFGVIDKDGNEERFHCMRTLLTVNPDKRPPDVSELGLQAALIELRHCNPMDCNGRKCDNDLFEMLLCSLPKDDVYFCGDEEMTIGEFNQMVRDEDAKQEAEITAKG